MSQPFDADTAAMRTGAGELSTAGSGFSTAGAQAAGAAGSAGGGVNGGGLAGALAALGAELQSRTQELANAAAAAAGNVVTAAGTYETVDTGAAGAIDGTVGGGTSDSAAGR